AGGFISHLTSTGIDQRRQTTALTPGGIRSHVYHLTMSFSLHHKPFDQVIEVDGEALFGQADSDILEVDIYRDIFGLDAEKGFKRLEDHRIGELRPLDHIFRPPHPDTSAAR